MHERGSISVGLDGSPERGDRSIVVPEVRLGDTRLCHPIIRFAVPRRKAERLQYMGLGFLGSTGKTLAETDPSVSWGQILIELQRLRGTRQSLSKDFPKLINNKAELRVFFESASHDI
jgi:hypothetical protein